ncbi:hypothetical protein [Streptomyces griseocarneus]|nr:hypothetical protein [Streptomyces griseocarneus]MBZ6471806.1 hypothetical protein [Streptomyces griseocarneus]
MDSPGWRATGHRGRPGTVSPEKSTGRPLMWFTTGFTTGDLRRCDTFR